MWKSEPVKKLSLILTRLKHCKEQVAEWESEILTSSDEEKPPKPRGERSRSAVPVDSSVSESQQHDTGLRRFREMKGILSRKAVPTNLRALIAVEDAVIDEDERVCSTC